MITAYYIDGREETLDKLSLEKAQEIVEGYVEVLVIGNVQLLCNEEGLLKNMPINHVVGAMMNIALRGNVIMLTPPDLWS